MIPAAAGMSSGVTFPDSQGRSHPPTPSALPPAPCWLQLLEPGTQLTESLNFRSEWDHMLKVRGDRAFVPGGQGSRAGRIGGFHARILMMVCAVTMKEGLPSCRHLVDLSDFSFVLCLHLQ